MDQKLIFNYWMFLEDLFNVVQYNVILIFLKDLIFNIKQKMNVHKIHKMIVNKIINKQIKYNMSKIIID